MSLTNYGELKTAIATRLARSNMTSLIPDFITITESQLKYGVAEDFVSGRKAVPPLRFSDMLTESDLTPSSGSATLPTDFLEAKRVYTNNSNTTPLEFRPNTDWYGLSIEGQSGIPQFFTVENNTMLIAPADSNTLKLLYYAAFDALSDDADTNAIFTKAPQIYLFGALAQANDHIRQHDRASFYHNAFASAVKGLNDADDQDQMSGSLLRMIPSVVC